MINIPQRNDLGRQLVIKKDGRSYRLPYNWSIDGDGNVSYRIKENQKAYAHGAVISGDRKIDSRTLTIEIYVFGTDVDDYQNRVNEVYNHFGQNDYQLFAGMQDSYYRVAGVSKIKNSYLKSYKQTAAKVEITLVLADPFRYSAAQTLRKEVFNEEQTETAITLFNAGSVDTPLIWRFIPLPDGGVMHDITITHVESGEFFKLKDTLLTDPANVIVNGQAGTVRRVDNNAGNSLNTFSGLFLHALPGRNTYMYTGAAGTIEIAFEERWLT